MLVIVTGASRGIGYELVKQFALLSNATVFAVSRRKPVFDMDSGPDGSRIIPVSADISTEKGRAEITELVRKADAKLDVLVNNAGLLINKPFSEISDQEMESVYRTNVFAPFGLCRSLVPFMKERSHIVNIGSMGGFQGSAKFPGLSAYSGSKAALANLTECLAEELKDRKIAVNCICPGAVQTEMLAEAFPGYQARVNAEQMARFICDFACNGHQLFNGKILPVSLSTP